MDVGKAGYGWLQKIANGSPHPGLDINGLGGGNTDIGYEYTSDCDGKVIYVSETTKMDGWGKMVVVEEDVVLNALQATPKPVEPSTLIPVIETQQIKESVEITPSQEVKQTTYQDLADPKSQFKEMMDSLAYYLKKLINLIK